MMRRVFNHCAAGTSLVKCMQSLMQGQKTLRVSSTPARLPRWCCSLSTGSTHWGSSPLLSNLVLTSLTTVIRIHMDCSRLWISSKVNALKSVNTWWNIGNGDIDFFIFRYRFCIISPKFPKFKRVQNIAKKIWKVKKRKCEIMKLTETGWNCCFMSLIILNVWEILLKLINFQWHLSPQTNIAVIYWNS